MGGSAERMIEYNKLVRDKIPEIVRQQGEIPYTRILDSEEYAELLEDKLDEEAAEFHRDHTPEELADILEVVFALAENMGISQGQLMDIWQEKHEARGGFSDRIFLIGKES